LNLISFLVANISGTIVQSNQTHLIINSGNDLVTTAGNIATVVGVGIALAVSIITLWKGNKDSTELRRVQDETIRQSKFQRLADVYKLTNSPKLREARKNIFHAYNFYMKKHYASSGMLVCMSYNKTGKTYTAVNLENLKGTKFDDIYTDPPTLEHLDEENKNRLRQDIELVRATLDNIGTLFNQDLIPEEALLQETWGVGIYCWDALKDQIYIERDRRGTMYYMDNFETFYKKIEEYISRKKLPRVKLYYDE
jgi:hypothetical protein